MESNCFICGTRNQTVLESHSPIPEKYEVSDLDGNTVTLCANCRKAVNEIYNKEFFQQLGVESEKKITEEDTSGIANFRGPKSKAILLAVIDFASQIDNWDHCKGISYSEIVEEANHYKGTDIQVSASKVGQVLKRTDIKTKRFRDGTHVVDVNATDKAAKALGKPLPN